MQDATGNFENRTAANTLTGATTGAAAAASGAATAGAMGTAINKFISVRNEANLLRAAAAPKPIATPSFFMEAAEGAETAETGAAVAETGAALAETGAVVAETAAVAAETAAAAGGLVAAEESAAGIAMLPIPGARPVAAVVALSALIGAGLGLIN